MQESESRCINFYVSIYALAVCHAQRVGTASSIDASELHGAQIFFVFCDSSLLVSEFTFYV